MGRMKSLSDSTVQKAIQQRAMEHEEHNKDLTPDVSTCVLPLGTARTGRQREVDTAHFFLTIIQFAVHVISIFQHAATAYTT